LLEQIDQVIPDNQAKELFSIGYFHFASFKNSPITLFEKEFLLYSYICDLINKKVENDIHLKQFVRKYYYDFNSNKYFEVKDFYNYLICVADILDKFVDEGILKFIKTKDLSSIINIHQFFFKNFSICNKSISITSNNINDCIYKKNPSILYLIFKTLRFTSNLNFDNYMDYKLYFCIKNIDIKLKLEFLRQFVGEVFSSSESNFIDLVELFTLNSENYKNLINRSSSEITKLPVKRIKELELFYIDLVKYFFE